jgi:hypothetical protein
MTNQGTGRGQDAGLVLSFRLGEPASLPDRTSTVSNVHHMRKDQRFTVGA